MAMAGISANRLELLQIADAVAREKAIDRSIVIEAMEDAIQKAAKSRYGAENDIRCKIDVKTGEAAWQHRGFARASIIYADGKAIILDEDGDLAIAKLSPKEVTVLARAKVFETTSWSAPTLVGTTLYARDREKIVAIELGAP